MKDNSKLAYNITVAAEYLAVSKSFVYMLRKKEIIKGIKVGRNYIFPRKELDNFIKRCINLEIELSLERTFELMVT